LEGVKHKKIEIPADRGFAVTLVPESDAGPHMAMGFEGRHFKRSCESFYPMEHFDIEDMFGRRKKPKLSLCKEIRRGGKMSGPSGKRYWCHVIVGVENTGRGIAKHVAIAAKVNDPYEFKNWLRHTGKHFEFQKLDIPGSDKDMYSLGANVVVHPGASVSVLLIAFEIGEREKTIADIVVETEIMAEDMRKVEEKIVIKGDDIRAKIIPDNN